MPLQMQRLRKISLFNSETNDQQRWQDFFSFKLLNQKLKMRVLTFVLLSLTQCILNCKRSYSISSHRSKYLSQIQVHRPGQQYIVLGERKRIQASVK